MKQHMLTHKIRDMPQHMFGSPTGGGNASATSAGSDSKSDKSDRPGSRRSADYDSAEKTRRGQDDSTNNNNQREKNNNMEGKASSQIRHETGMKRPTSEPDDHVQSKRPLSEFYSCYISVFYEIQSERNPNWNLKCFLRLLFNSNLPPFVLSNIFLT